jgi:hypothetical protein
MLTPDYKTTENSIQMASDGKGSDMKVVRLIESVDFDIKIIIIRGRLQPVQPKQGQGHNLQSHYGPTELI